MAWLVEHPDLNVTETTELDDGSTVLVLGAIEGDDVPLLCSIHDCNWQASGNLIKLQVGSRDGVPFAISIISDGADSYEAFEAKAAAVVTTIELTP